MRELITGIQQVGIGVEDADHAKYLYRDLFGMDVLVFDDVAEASLMTRYTGNEIHHRRAILSLNMQGGGGFEIWQFKKRKPCKSADLPTIGDLGIFAIKLKSADIQKAYEYLAAQPGVQISVIYHLPDERKALWFIDPYGNRFQVIEMPDLFKKTRHICGGVIGAVIGVSNMDKAVDFYKNLLGIHKEIYHISTTEKDILLNNSTEQSVHKVLLTKDAGVTGAFSKLLGHIVLELVKSTNRQPQKIYHQRYWGDCGFIHHCFDVLNMNLLKEKAIASGYSFTVDSADSFSMGASAGRFCYVEDPDGTLIELVETHKVPVLKKLGLFIDLTKRKHNKPLPNWMVGMLALSKIK